MLSVGMRLSWARLIGIISGTFGAGAAATTVVQLCTVGLRETLVSANIFVICGWVFLLLAVPLYAGREWARRVLLLTSYCLFVGFAILVPLLLSHKPRSPAELAHPYLRPLTLIFGTISFLAPSVFILAALHHSDVRRAFRSRSASNQTMQPTASPGTAPLLDD
jgi:hypothetical protein